MPVSAGCKAARAPAPAPAKPAPALLGRLRRAYAGCRVLSRICTFQVRTLPASLPRLLFARQSLGTNTWGNTDEPKQQEGAVRRGAADEPDRAYEQRGRETDDPHLVADLDDLPGDGRTHDRRPRRSQARARL